MFFEKAEIARPVTLAEVNLNPESLIWGTSAARKFKLGFLFIKEES